MQSWLQSSADPTLVSNTVRGLVLSFSAVIIIVGNLLNIPLTDSQIAQFAAGAGLAAGSLWTLYGLVLKLVVFFGKSREINIKE